MSRAQRRAVDNYRHRLTERGWSRFEVVGLEADKTLLRSLARRLADQTAESAELRASIGRALTDEKPRKGGVLAALRRSPLVGAELDLSRSSEQGRDVDF